MNVCLIILDDVGLDLLSSSHTPVIDRLVTAGTVYDRFVAAPSCSNFRAKVETGYYSIRPENWVGGIFRNTTSASLPTDNQYLLAKRVPNADQVGKWHLPRLRFDRQHVPRVGENGYATARSARRMPTPQRNGSRTKRRWKKGKGKGN